MLNDGDHDQMQADLQSILEDRPASIALRRAGTTLTAQEVRVARLSSHSRSTGEASREMRGSILVAGAPDLDIQVDDRFTIDASLYQVRFVRPNRDAGTQAEAELMQ